MSLSVLFLPSWYPTPDSPISGIFIKRHAQAVSAKHNVAVLFVFPAGEMAPKEKAVSSGDEDGLFTVRSSYQPVRWRIPFLSAAVFYWRYLRAGSRGYREISRKLGPIDICHVGVAKPAGLLALALKLKSGLPYIITEHSSGYTHEQGLFEHASLSGRLIIRLIFNYTSAVTAVSQYLLDALKEHGLCKRMHLVIPNVIMTRKAVEVRNRVSERPIILAVSINEQAKNVSGLLKAFAAVAPRHDNIELHLIGGGADQPWLEQLADSMGLLRRQVFFHGYVIPEKMEAFFRQAAFFVMNSNYETFSAATAEALMYGLPVVVTACGGPEEYVTPEMGLVVEKQNHEELTAAMEYMIAHWQDFDPTKLHEAVHSRFSAEVVAESFDRLYRKVLGKASAASDSKTS